MPDYNLPLTSRTPTKREDEIVAESLQEFAQLQTYRHTFAAHWEEIAELILPTSRNTFEYGTYNFPGQKKTDRQVDATGMMALAKFSAICNSLLTPKNMMWHGLRADDDYVMADRETRLWFEQATKILFSLRYAQYSGFAGQISDCYTQLGAFGTKGMFIDEFDMTQHPYQPGIRYRSIPLGELFIRKNHQRIVDGFCRWVRLTAMQCYQKFGPERFPPTLKPALEKGSQQLYDFLHRVCPRSDYDRERLDERGKPWASYYVSLTDKLLLSEGGYRKFPAAISTYADAPGEDYGRSPAMMVLPSLKTLNAEKRTFLKAGHRAADPVLLTTDDGIVDPSLRPGALNKGGMSQDGKPLIGTIPIGNIQISKEMMAEEKALIEDAFLVNLFQLALNLKDLPQMTATQVIEITNQKGILLAPTVGNQEDDLGHMIERELDVAMAIGAFRNYPMPPRLREAKGSYKVVYTSPLSKAARAQNASGFMRTVEVAKEIANVTQDMSIMDSFNFDVALPEIADIQGTPVAWMADDDMIAAKRKNRAQALQRQEEIQAAPAKAAIIKAQAVAAKAGMTPPGQAPAQGGPPLQQQVQGA
jgi:hypothetical protein